MTQFTLDVYDEIQDLNNTILRTQRNISTYQSIVVRCHLKENYLTVRTYATYDRPDYDYVMKLSDRQLDYIKKNYNFNIW